MYPAAFSKLLANKSDNGLASTRQPHYGSRTKSIGIGDTRRRGIVIFASPKMEEKREKRVDISTYVPGNANSGYILEVKTFQVRKVHRKTPKTIGAMVRRPLPFLLWHRFGHKGLDETGTG